MAHYSVRFMPLREAVRVKSGTSLLEAAGQAGILINSVCGGDGICGRCKMIVRKGRVGGEATLLLTPEEIRQGMVLACQTRVQSDLLVDIPEETRAGKKSEVDKDARRFRARRPGISRRKFADSPLVSRIFLELQKPSLEDNLADYQRLQRALARDAGITSLQAGLKILKRLPEILRSSDYRVTATIGRRGDVAEVMDIEAGDADAVVLTLRGEEVRYDVARATVTVRGRSASLTAVDGRIELRVLLDRTSIEVFGNGGLLSMSACFLPAPGDVRVSLCVAGGSAGVGEMEVWELRSAWESD